MFCVVVLVSAARGFAPDVCTSVAFGGICRLFARLAMASSDTARIKRFAGLLLWFRLLVTCVLGSLLAMRCASCWLRPYMCVMWFPAFCSAGARCVATLPVPIMVIFSPMLWLCCA